MQTLSHLLAHTDLKKREAGFQSLKNQVQSYWMSDKPLVQQELANNLAELIFVAKNPFELDKYYNLRKCVLYKSFEWLKQTDFEQLEQYQEMMSELVLGINVPKGIISKEHALQLLQPLVNVIKNNHNAVVCERVLSMFDVYEQESWMRSKIPPKDLALVLLPLSQDEQVTKKNRSLLQDYLVKWSEWVKIPYTPVQVITGLKKSVVPIPWQQHLKALEQDPQINASDAVSDVPMEEVKEEKESKKKRSAESTSDVSKKQKKAESVEVTKKQKKAESVDATKTQKADAKQKDNKKQSKVKVAQEEPEKEEEQEEQVEKQEEDWTTVSESPRKVTWKTTLKVRKFHKKIPICSSDEAKVMPTYTGKLKPVLKPQTKIERKPLKKGHRRAKSTDHFY
ncbi:hypothetical protein EDD86DRAFT_248384 [Gorgonomyces haynaldii]|nr:hypothetical protein EDD86DRAFT_248384 [Gorgonomyces haynaldii]